MKGKTITIPAGAKPKPMTAEERKEQALRIVAQQYRSTFQGCVFNLCQNPAFDPYDATRVPKLVATAKAIAEATMDVLFPAPEEHAEETPKE